MSNNNDENRQTQETKSGSSELKVELDPSSKMKSTENKGEKDHRLLPISDGQYRRSLSEDQKPTTLPDHRYLSTECMASNPLSDAKDWKTSSSYLNTAPSNVGSKFGGSTFSITRHKKIDLSAYDEELPETNPKSKNDDQDTQETLPTIGIVSADSYDVLEKAAAIALEQVS